LLRRPRLYRSCSAKEEEEEEEEEEEGEEEGEEEREEEDFYCVSTVVYGKLTRISCTGGYEGDVKQRGRC
jgi:hypothetical protein